MRQRSAGRFPTCTFSPSSIWNVYHTEAAMGHDIPDTGDRVRNAQLPTQCRDANRSESLRLASGTDWCGRLLSHFSGRTRPALRLDALLIAPGEIPERA